MTTVQDPRLRRLILLATCTALMAVVASASGLNVAQPQLAEAFDASQSTVLWFINLYIVALAATLMPIGAIGDRWGRKPVLLAGLALFTLATLASAGAPTSTFMLGSRVVAGIAAAMIMPVTLSVITSSFPANARSQAIGIWSGVAGAGGLLGMLVSALMIDLVDWRLLFALPIALAVAAFALTWRAIPASHHRAKGRFDFGGSILSMLGVGALVFAVHEGPGRGWTHALTLVLLVIGVLTTAAFARWELRHPAPLFDVRVFGDRRLATGSVTLLFVFGVMAGIFIVLFPFFQAVLGWSALRSMLGLLPITLAMMVASGLAPKLGHQIGPRQTILFGIALSGIGIAVMAASVSADGGYIAVLPGMVVIGVGMGISMPPATEFITASLPDSKQGVASALNDSTRELGSALGVALLGAVLSAGYRDALTPHLTTVPDAVGVAATRGIGPAIGIAPQLGAQAESFVRASRTAFVEGWAGAMWVSVAVMSVLFAYVLLLGPGCSSPPAHNAHSHSGAFANAHDHAHRFDDPARDEWQRPEDVLRALQLTPAMTVGDVGAGTGYFSVRLARALPEGQVIATDLEPSMTYYIEERARREALPNIRTVLATPTRSGLAPRSVDAILVVHVWHHIRDRVSYARDLAAALRQGGRLLIVDFDPRAEEGPPMHMRIAADAIVADLVSAGLVASVSTITLPRQYIVEARHP